MCSIPLVVNLNKQYMQGISKGLFLSIFVLDCTNIHILENYISLPLLPSASSSKKLDTLNAKCLRYVHLSNQNH